MSREWQVFEASERRIDKKIAGEVELSLKAINFDQLTRGLLGAILKGFSVAEILWVRMVHAGPSAVKVKKQRRFRFDIDGRLRMLTRSSPIEGVELPDRKFIVHRHSIDDDDDDPIASALAPSCSGRPGSSARCWRTGCRRRASMRLPLHLRSTRAQYDRQEA